MPEGRVPEARQDWTQPKALVPLPRGLIAVDVRFFFFVLEAPRRRRRLPIIVTGGTEPYTGLNTYKVVYGSPMRMQI